MISKMPAGKRRRSPLPGEPRSAGASSARGRGRSGPSRTREWPGGSPPCRTPGRRPARPAPVECSPLDKLREGRDAVSDKLARLEARRFGTTVAPRKSLGDTSVAPKSRYVPAAVRRAVYQRDGGRCAFIDDQGRRCTARDRLEFHHRYPFGYGGEHDPENLSLMCRTHNAYVAEVDYGRKRGRGRRGNETASPTGK
jgi:hypothetical protein